MKKLTRNTYIENCFETGLLQKEVAKHLEFKSIEEIAKWEYGVKTLSIRIYLNLHKYMKANPKNYFQKF